MTSFPVWCAPTLSLWVEPIRKTSVYVIKSEYLIHWNHDSCQFWSKRSNLSLEQKNSISVFVLGVFSDFLTFVFSWLCGVFRILWCVFLLLMYFSIFVIFFLLYWYFLTFVIFNDNCVFVFDFCSIFWLLGYFLTFVGVRYFLGVIA